MVLVSFIPWLLRFASCEFKTFDELAALKAEHQIPEDGGKLVGRARPN